MMTKQAELKQRAYASNLKSRALSILIYLIDRSNKELTCFPSIPIMAEQLHISISTVKRALHELVDAGFIQKDARFREKNRGQTSNLYTLMFRKETPTPNNDNSSADNGEASINVPGDHDNAAKGDYTPTHISFDTIVREAAPPEPEIEAPPETEVLLENMVGAETALPGQAAYKPIHMAKHSPVHSVFLRRLIPHCTAPADKENAGRFLPCNLFVRLWTGAESILIPP